MAYCNDRPAKLTLFGNSNSRLRRNSQKHILYNVFARPKASCSLIYSRSADKPKTDKKQQTKNIKILNKY